MKSDFRETWNNKGKVNEFLSSWISRFSSMSSTGLLKDVDHTSIQTL